MVAFDDMLDCLSDERVANMVVARLEKCLAPIVERLFNSLGAEFTSKLESIVDGMTKTSLEKHCHDIKEKITYLDKENQSLKIKLEETENQLNHDNLILYGLVEGSSNNAEQLLLDPSTKVNGTTWSVLDLCNNRLGFPLESQMLLSLTGSQDPLKGQRPLLVRFVSRRIHDMVYAARKSLKDQQADRPVYINEHLTRLNSLLFAEARKSVKKNYSAQHGHMGDWYSSVARMLPVTSHVRFLQPWTRRISLMQMLPAMHH